MRNAYSYALSVPQTDLFIVKLPVCGWGIADGRGASLGDDDSWHLPVFFESKKMAEETASTMPHVWFSLEVDGEMVRHCLKKGGILLPQEAR